MALIKSREEITERTEDCPGCKKGKLKVVIRLYPQYDNALSVQIVESTCNCYFDIWGNNHPKLVALRQSILDETRKEVPRNRTVI
jgi:hypothetical protein